MSQYDVANTKKLIHVVAEVGNAFGGAFEDGKLTTADTKEVEHLWPIITELSTIQYSLLVPEWKDIDPIEGQEIIACFCEYFDIPQDIVEDPLEFVLKFLSTGIEFVRSLIALIKSRKKPALA